jgi:hypothetical protein
MQHSLLFRWFVGLPGIDEHFLAVTLSNHFPDPLLAEFLHAGKSPTCGSIW